MPVIVGHLQIDPLAHTVTVGGRPVDLSPREFDVLHVLALPAVAAGVITLAALYYHSG